MGFRFRQTLRLGRLLRINLSKGGASASVGRPGATLNVGPKGPRVTVGAPGTGISYDTKVGRGCLGLVALAAMAATLILIR